MVRQPTVKTNTTGSPAPATCLGCGCPDTQTRRGPSSLQGVTHTAGRERRMSGRGRETKTTTAIYVYSLVVGQLFSGGTPCVPLPSAICPDHGTSYHPSAARTLSLLRSPAALLDDPSSLHKTVDPSRIFRQLEQRTYLPITPQLIPKMFL